MVEKFFSILKKTSDDLDKPENQTLTGKYVQLEPLHEKHKEDLHKASQDDRIWTYNFIRLDAPDRFDRWFTAALFAHKSDASIVYAIRLLKNHKIIGTTRFYDYATALKRLKIGFTWYHPDYWGTNVNPESKLLLLQHAFEQLHVNRVSFEADARNIRSLRAIKSLGAKHEGILRHHVQYENGYIRDTSVFSIIAKEWPEVRKLLEKRITDNKLAS